MAIIELVRSPTISEADAKRRLAMVYNLILTLVDENETAGGGEPGRASPSAACDTPVDEQPGAHKEV